MKANAQKLYLAYVANGNKVALADMLKKYPEFGDTPKETPKEAPKKKVFK